MKLKNTWAIVLSMLSLTVFTADPVLAAPSGMQADEAEPARSAPVRLRHIGRNAETIVVSGDSPLAPDRRVKLQIDRPGKSVLLIVTSYEKLSWQVEASPATGLRAVLLSGNPRSKVAVPAGVGSHRVELPRVSEAGSRPFVEMLQQLDAWFGVRKADAFVYQSELPAAMTVSRLDPPNPKLLLDEAPPQKPVFDFVFELMDRDYAPVKWTPRGPLLKAAAEPASEAQSSRRASADPSYPLERDSALRSPDGATLYRVDEDKGLILTSVESGRQTVLPLPDHFPDFSWAMGLAYDSRRQLVSVVSLGGEGYFYRFDAKRKRWLDYRSMKGLDLHALAYDAETDRYLGWEEYREGLVWLSATGETVERHDMAGSLPGYYRLLEKGNGPEPKMWLFPFQDQVALMAFDQDRQPQRIWLYDVQLRRAVETYRARRVGTMGR